MKKLEKAGISNAIKFYLVYEEERKLIPEDNNEQSNGNDQQNGNNNEKSLVIMMESGECSLGELLKVRERYSL